jgi:hypothetical protein
MSATQKKLSDSAQIEALRFAIVCVQGRAKATQSEQTVHVQRLEYLIARIEKARDARPMRSHGGQQ